MVYPTENSGGRRHAAIKKLQPQPPAGGHPACQRSQSARRARLSPVVDGTIVRGILSIPPRRNISAGVPMIVGTVLNEMSPSMTTRRSNR